MEFINLVIVLALLSAMIIVHEFGHWVVARKLGFQTPVFGFGLPFGKHITLGKWKETEFRFHWFVLGGFVAIPELGDETSEDMLDDIPDMKPMQTFPVWKRACVASAGVLFNLIFAFVMCLIMVATVGPPSPDREIVITEIFDNAKAAKAYDTEVNTAAKDAGLKAGDVILKIGDVEVKTSEAVVKNIYLHKGEPVNFEIKRRYVENNEKKFKIFNRVVTPNEDGKIGIGYGLAGTGEYLAPSKNPLIWIVQALQVMFQWTFTMLLGLWMLILNLVGLAPKGTPQMNAGDLHGIVAIVSVFAQAITIDFREIFRWSALININLAIINLLPIPALDGGHLFFMLIEKLRGKKIAETIQQRATQYGFTFLLVLMAFVIFNDIKGLATGKFDVKDKSSIEASQEEE